MQIFLICIYLSYIYIYIYIRVILKTQKWYLMPPCLTLNIIRYGSRVCEAILGKEQRPPLHLSVVAIEKGAFRSPWLWSADLRLGHLNYSGWDIYIRREFKSTNISVTWSTMLLPRSWRWRNIRDREMRSSPDTLRVKLTRLSLVMKMTNHNGLRDVELAWYSQSSPHWICLQDLEHSLEIRGLRSKTSFL